MSSNNRTLKDRYLLHVFAVRFVDSLTTMTLMFTAPLLIYNATHSAAWSGISFLLQWLPCLTALPLAGPLVDRFGPRRIFVITNTARLFILVLATIGLTLYPHVWFIIVGLAICGGLLARVSFVAAEHLGKTVGQSRKAHRIQAIQVGIDQTVQVVGPMLGGLLLFLGRNVVLSTIALLAFVSVLLSFKLRVAQSATQTRKRSIIQSLRGGFQVIARDKALRFTVINTAASNLLLALITVMTPAFVEQRFHLGASSVGMLWTAGAITSIVSVMFAGRAIERLGIVQVGRMATFLCCLTALFAGYANTFAAYLIFVAAFLCADGVVAVFLRTIRVQLIPAAQYGSAVGAMLLILLLPYPLAGAFLAIVPFKDITSLLSLCAIGVAAVAGYSFLQIQRQVEPVSSLQPELQNT